MIANHLERLRSALIWLLSVVLSSATGAADRLPKPGVYREGWLSRRRPSTCVPIPMNKYSNLSTAVTRSVIYEVDHHGLQL